ncbi:MAG: hypothetical protein ABR516_00005 [Desulfuromonadaceae bacterium]|nr:hypothetical protein [Geobacteraceae bacterium]
MDRRTFLTTLGFGLAGSVTLLCAGGCIAPRVSPEVYDDSSMQAWRCGNCGHLTRSDQDLTSERCPRCKRKGYFVRITHKELQNYLKAYTNS